MKKITLFFIVFITLKGFSQKCYNQIFTNLDNIVVAELNNSNPFFSINKEDLIETINYEFQQFHFSSVNIITELYENKTYYYLLFSSKNMQNNGVMQLFKNNNILTLKNDRGLRITTCIGYNRCFPNFISVEENFILFSCDDAGLCRNDNLVTTQTCMRSNGLIFY